MRLADRVAAWAAEGQLDALAALEALADPRIAARAGAADAGLPAERLLREAAAQVAGGTPASLEHELRAAGAIRDRALIALPELIAQEARSALVAAATARPATWSRDALTHGGVLDRFVAYCRDELDDVSVVTAAPGAALLAWRDERARVELRHSALFAERLEGAPWLLLAPVAGALVERFLDLADLRARVAVVDLADLAKVSAVRSSVLVHLEWFLRDEYQAKLLPAQDFNQGLLARGIISLGM